MNPDGSLCYSVDVSQITGVLGAHIGTKNGTELADLTNPYATMQFYPTGTIGAYPTASVNRTLTSGDIKAGLRRPPGQGGVISPLGLVGPLIGKNVTDLDNILKTKNGYVTVRTRPSTWRNSRTNTSKFHSKLSYYYEICSSYDLAFTQQYALLTSVTI